jgi:hypothetical protein
MIASSSSSTSGQIVHAFGYSASAMRLSTSCGLRPENGSDPVDSWYSMMPTANRSVRASIGLPLISSGAM